jgi:hypothetical protein
MLWAWLCTGWNDWQSGIFIVKASTVIGWHRKGFRLFWAWKVRYGKPGRPGVPKEVRALIRTLSRENPLWGAPRIHGELLKLGIDIGETSVSKYVVRGHKPPSQTWRTFLDNHVKSMVSVDFFTVPTIRFQFLYVFLVLAHDGGAFCILASPLTRPPSGPLSNYARPSRGRPRRAICCAIAIGSSGRTLCSR